MAESQIPPAFRQALDEPAPPDPPEMDADDDGGDGHHIHIMRPVLMLFSNGGHETMSIDGTVLLGWFWIASFVTVWTVADWIWWWLARRGWLEAVWDAGFGFAWFMVGWLAAAGLWGWWKSRRAGRKP